MIDLFTLALTHGLILLALLRLLSRPDLDEEQAPKGPLKPWLRRAAGATGEESADA